MQLDEAAGLEAGGYQHEVGAGNDLVRQRRAELHNALGCIWELLVKLQQLPLQGFLACSRGTAVSTAEDRRHVPLCWPAVLQVSCVRVWRNMVAGSTGHAATNQRETEARGATAQVSSPLTCSQNGHLHLLAACSAAQLLSALQGSHIYSRAHRLRSLQGPAAGDQPQAELHIPEAGQHRTS